MTSTRDVAQQAGVSIGTVSRVLNNQPGVSGPVRERVLAVAERLDYTPARRIPLPAARVTHFGLLVKPRLPDLSANPFYSDVYHGIEQACRDHHINLSFSSLNTADERLVVRPPLLSDDRVRGLVLTGAMSRSLLESVVSPRGLPAVLVDNWFPGCPWDAVMIDNWAGATLAAEHLIANGHSCIGYLDGPDHPSIIERRSAYLNVMQQQGLEPRILACPELETPEGARGIAALLDAWPDTTGVLCANDSLALGAMLALRERGYRIPEDISLVGFDDISSAQLMSPALTTVHVDRVALGRMAVELLLSRIASPAHPPIRCVVGVHLVQRASVCAPAASRGSVGTRGVVMPANVRRAAST